MRTNLGHTSKASADHVPLFTDGHRIGFALVAVFTIGAAILSFITFGAPEMERQAKVHQENVHVVRR